MNDKILLFGGTGAMGLALENLMRGGHYEVYITSRSKHKSYGNIHYVELNGLDYDAVNEYVKDKHFLAVFDFMLYLSLKNFKRSLTLLSNHTDQYFFFSSSRVYAESDNITEESPRLLDTCKDTEYLATNEYALAKAREEDIIRKSGLHNITIIRPYITYNENRLQLGAFEKEVWLFRALHNHSIVFFNELMLKKTALTDSHDTAELLLGLIGKPDAIGTTFQIANNESTPWSDILNLYLDVLKKEIHYDKKPVIIGGAEKMGYIQGNLYQVKVDRMYNRSFDSSKVLTVSESIGGFTPVEVGLKNAIEGFLKNWKQNPSQTIKGSNWLVQGVVDRITHEWFTKEELNQIGAKDKIKYYAGRLLPIELVYKIRKSKMKNGR